ncbi:MAG TPA: MFS transporter [Ensifer sp.]|jgi:DHA1 family purine base/nucleoside efflux pump-like MFS transporter|uniref:MFS transporter n=1 Tax=Ensifer sp. TaxID=1872086 RepID=UPI002E0F14C8|nr:MFS transporter [Ensifer sp.]
MNPIVILLAFATFATGTAENIVVGIVSDVAGDLGVSLAIAGQLTAVFSIVFALTAPLALVLTMKIERRRLLLCALGLFIASNLCAAASPNLAMLVVARIGMAMASATVCLLATMLATELVAQDMRGRAIGLIFMGISGSLVLGVPAGILICGLVGWRGVFVALSLLAGLVWLVSWRHVPISACRRAALPRYLDHLRKPPLVAGQFVSILMIGGHFVLFAFLGPYLVQIGGVAVDDIAIAFAVLGVAGVSGGYLGGWLADRFSPRNVLLLTPAAYLLALVTIALVEGTAWLMFGVLMIWACISWMVSPVVQSFLISAGPATADAGISLNLSTMHIGVGLGTAVGGIALASLSIHALPWVGAIIAALALVASCCAFWSSRLAARSQELSGPSQKPCRVKTSLALKA